MKYTTVKHKSWLLVLMSMAIPLFLSVEAVRSNRDRHMNAVEKTTTRISNVDVAAQTSPPSVSPFERLLVDPVAVNLTQPESTNPAREVSGSQIDTHTGAKNSQLEKVESTFLDNVFDGSHIKEPTVIDLNIPIIEENLIDPTNQLPLEYKNRLSEALSMDISFSLNGVPGTTTLNLKSSSLPDIRQAVQQAADLYNSRLTERSMPNAGLVPDNFRISAIVFP